TRILHPLLARCGPSVLDPPTEQMWSIFLFLSRESCRLESPESIALHPAWRRRRDAWALRSTTSPLSGGDEDGLCIALPLAGGRGHEWAQIGRWRGAEPTITRRAPSSQA